MRSRLNDKQLIVQLAAVCEVALRIGLHHPIINRRISAALPTSVVRTTSGCCVVDLLPPVRLVPRPRRITMRRARRGMVRRAGTQGVQLVFELSDPTQIPHQQGNREHV
jgi:hypothetical protein